LVELFKTRGGLAAICESVRRIGRREEKLFAPMDDTVSPQGRITEYLWLCGTADVNIEGNIPRFLQY